VLRKTFESLVYYQFDRMSSAPGRPVHAMFSRLGGKSEAPWTSLNTGHTVGDDPTAVESNHQLICAALGIGRHDLVSPHQVHGTRVRIVGAEDRGTVCPETDALVTGTAGVYLMLRFADCVPLLFYDPACAVVGLAHAGWRGTVAQIGRATVETMTAAFGCKPGDIVAGIGPSIGPCCYEVGEDVAQAVWRAFPGEDGVLEPRPNGRWHFDLWTANQLQLEGAGVGTVQIAGVCTACQTDEWYSHRAERGRTGRWAALIGMRPA